MHRRIQLLLIPFLLLTFLLFNYSCLYQNVNPAELASAAIKLYVNKNNIETISSLPEKYLVKSKDGIDAFISTMENRGFFYQNHIDDGIVFIKNGQLFSVISRMYSKNYMIVSVPSGAPTDLPQETITLTATGDILMHNTVIDSGRQGSSYNYDHLYAPIIHLLEEGDYASVNLESAIAGPAKGYTGYPLFNSPDSIATALKNSGFDLVVTASNHTLDRGYKGALRTLDILREAGLDTAGTYKTPEEKNTHLIKDIRGVKVGYLTYSYDTNGIPLPADKPYFYNLLERERIISEISALRPQVDVLILILHWGVEYSPYPTQQQRKLAREFFTKGADVILGSHPHVIQPMETMQINGKDKFVIYSMGNSMGNQNGVERNSGVIVKLEFTKDFNLNETSLNGITCTPIFMHPYHENGRRMFRAVPVEATIQAIKAGKDPYLQSDSLPLLQQVLADSIKQLNRPLK
ncbi:MAG: CapA family protein [Syntrophomonas sp.]|nr:CapA family protein [Syntrophomonas sp.]